jgi:acyl CoA:acetate/3-ketoacid CoA transferase
MQKKRTVNYMPVIKNGDVATNNQGRRVHGCGGSIAILQKCNKHIFANFKKFFILRNIN